MRLHLKKTALNELFFNINFLKISVKLKLNNYETQNTILRIQETKY